MMKLIVTIIVSFFCSNASASDEFNAENPIENPETIPASILSQLGLRIDLVKNNCVERNLADALEGKSVILSSTTKAFFVKPKAWCLCGAYYCPMWVYQLNSNQAQLVWSTSGTSGVEILDKKAQGYRGIKESGGTAGHSHERIWGWNGKGYAIEKEKYTP